MKKIYHVEVTKTPTHYTVTASTDQEAIEKASALFTEQYNGANIYETIITGVEDTK